MIKAVIIDDEPRAQRMLAALITEYCTDVDIAAIANDVPSGVIAINKVQPDVLFLDVEMPGYTGFQLLDFFRDINFEIVFTTAHSDYALQAFQVSAIDFLLKPIQISELQRAIERVRTQIPWRQQRLDALRENFETTSIRKIALPMHDGIEFIATQDIIYLMADGAYTTFHLLNGRTIVVSKKIKEFEQALVTFNQFFRSHRSYIINTAKISRYVKQDGGFIKMDDGTEVPLARERKDEFNSLIKKISW